MASPLSSTCCGITRRGFLVGAGAGLVGGASLSWLGMRAWKRLHSGDADPFTARSREIEHPTHAMPGPFPGRVIEVHRPDAVSPDNDINSAAVKAMMDRGMIELTGADHPQEAWKRFFEPDDV